MAQLVEHIVHIDGVTGSSPVATTKTLENTTFSRVFLFLQKPLCSFWSAEMNEIHPAVHIEIYMIPERYILLPCPEGCSKSGVFTVLHNKVPAS